MIDAKNKPFVEADGKHPKGTKDNRKYCSEIKSSWNACCARYEPPYLKVDIDDYDHSSGAIKDPVNGKCKSDVVCLMLEAEGIKYNAVQTANGKHLYFKVPDGLLSSNKINWFTPIGIQMEWKLPTSDDHIAVKRQGNIIVPIKDFFVNLWNDIVGVFSVVSDWFTTNIADPIKNIFTNIWNTLKNGASNAWNGIKNVFGSVADWFKNIFSKSWQAVKNVFSTGGKVFEGIKDGIVKAFKTVVNAIIRGINKVIKVPFDGINWALNKIKGINILGVEPFGWISTINTPQIPELKKGGVLEKGQVGLLEGDGAEAVVPLEENTGWIRNVAKQIHNFVIETKDTSRDIAGNIRMQQLEQFYGQNEKVKLSLIEMIDSRFEKMMELFNEYFPMFAEGQTISMDGRTFAEVASPYIDRELGKIQRRKEWG